VAVTGARDVGAYRVLDAADPDGPQPWPGQFYMLAAVQRWGAGEDERPYLPRAFSFLRAGDGSLSFMFEDVGPGTARLAELDDGDELWLLGPLGIGFTAPGGDRRAILAGGGIGIPPLSAWAGELAGQGIAAQALLGFRDAWHAEGAELLQDAAVRVATDDGSVGHHGLVTDLLATALDEDPGATVYACGPPAMLEAVRALCAAREASAQLALEAGMACGFGACYGCVVPVREGGFVRLCVDGPVLDAGRIDAVPAHA
jgi:NAD(P)H-flavin reductase